jgi:hypothetical protein
MRIPFGHRHLVVDVEKVVPMIRGESLLDGATDREMEHFAQNAKTVREPRWDAHSLMLGFRP